MFANAHSQLIAPLTAAALSALPLGQTAYAELLIKVDKSTQRMAVSVRRAALQLAGDDRRERLRHAGWHVKPFRMEIDHYSDEYDNAPMPYSIFFTQTGNAIHGTSFGF